jgi:threonine/homoserine/homoserine lactone efflux protein
MDLVGFSLAVLVIELTPGPNMAWLAGLAATEGKRAGFAAVAGIALGLLANGLLAALGLATLLSAVPEAWSVLRIAGAIMMTILAVEAWRGSRANAAGPPGARRNRRSFVTGALINLLNPKAYIFFVVVAPQFLSGQTLGLIEGLTLAAVSAGIATIIHLAIVLAGSRAQDWLADPRRTVIARRVFACLMLAVAASFIMAEFA